MNIPLISVIMPTHNVERYFKQSLHSVIDQTLKEIEIIPIDDGSPDHCGEIMDQAAARDPRVKPIHQQNRGYGAAINAGLSAATGEYIAIVETDDWIEPEMLETLYSVARSQRHVPIVKASFMKHEASRAYPCSLRHITEGPMRTLEPQSSLELMIYESSIWSAIYKRDFLDENNIRMLETAGAAYQDVVWKFAAYSSAETVSLIDKPLYNYRVMATGSSSAAGGRENAMFRNYAEIRKFLDKNGKFEAFKSSYYVHQIFDFVFHSKRLSGEALTSFTRQARSVTQEATAAGIDANKLTFHEDADSYFRSEVLPLYNAISLLDENNETRAENAKPSESPPPATSTKKQNFISRIFHRAFIEPVERIVAENTRVQLDALHESNAKLSNELKLCRDLIVEAHDELKFSRNLIIETREVLAPVIAVPRSDQFEYYMRAHRGELPGKIASLKAGMDAESCFQIDRYFNIFRAMPVLGEHEQHLNIPLWLNILTDEERIILANKAKIFEKIREKYLNLDIDELPITFTNMYFECGLKIVPYSITETFKNTIALDCGGSVGDSAIPIARYGFKKVYVFEPLRQAFDVLCENIKKNELSAYIEPLKLGVDQASGEKFITKIGERGEGSLVSENGDERIETIDLDTFCEGLGDPINLIKYDIEGKELDGLKGAEKTIRRFKPVLLVAVYHTWLEPEQIFSIKAFIESLNLGYEFQFKWLEPDNVFYEHWLIAYIPK